MPEGDRPPELGYSVVAVGTPYTGIPSPERAGAALTLQPGRTELTMFMPSPNAGEIAEVQTGQADFGWISRPHSGMLCFRVGRLPYWDAPYEAHKAAVPGWPESVTPGMHQVLAIILVDTRTLITEAVHLMTWPPHFAGAVRDAVAGQLAVPRDDAAASSEIRQLWAAGDPEHLMRTYAQVTCTGGQDAVPENSQAPGREAPARRSPGRKAPGAEERRGRRTI